MLVPCFLLYLPAGEQILHTSVSLQLVWLLPEIYAPEGNQGLWQPCNYHMKVQVGFLMGQVHYTPSGEAKKQLLRHKAHYFNLVFLISVRNVSQTCLPNDSFCLNYTVTNCHDSILHYCIQIIIPKKELTAGIHF